MSENKITLEALAVEEKKVEIEQERDEWRLCCSKSSASLIRYIGQMVCCASVLTFSFYQISQDKHGDNSVYFSLISGIVGYLLPAPHCKKITINFNLIFFLF